MEGAKRAASRGMGGRGYECVGGEQLQLRSGVRDGECAPMVGGACVTAQARTVAERGDHPRGADADSTRIRHPSLPPIRLMHALLSMYVDVS